MAIFFLLAYHLRYAASFCPRPFRATTSPPHPPTPSTFSSLSPRGKLQQQHSLLLEVALLLVADSGRSLAWAIEHKVMTATSCSSGSSQCAALSAAAAAGRMQGMQLELTSRPAPNQQQLAAKPEATPLTCARSAALLPSTHPRPAPSPLNLSARPHTPAAPAVGGQRQQQQQ